MADTALHQGTLDYAVPSQAVGRCYCACGNLKDRRSERCQVCHIEYVDVLRRARQTMDAYLAYLERRRDRERAT